jgi:hypothetical protein
MPLVGKLANPDKELHDSIKKSELDNKANKEDGFKK